MAISLSTKDLLQKSHGVEIPHLIQAQIKRGYAGHVSTKKAEDINVAGITTLKNSSALAIKNKALQHNAIAFIGNNVAIQKQSEIEKESAEQVPAGVELLPNEKDVLIMPQEVDSEQVSDLEAIQREDGISDSEQGTFGPSYRVRFRFRHPQFGFRYGYRYPIWYWRRFGHRFYPARYSTPHNSLVSSMQIARKKRFWLDSFAGEKETDMKLSDEAFFYRLALLIPPSDPSKDLILFNTTRCGAERWQLGRFKVNYRFDDSLLQLGHIITFSICP
ncbi:hypothetical protein ABG067_006869 [Albugo candida]